MPDLKQEIQRRRTFAIISHPDAGKTTLTEKLLLYGGALTAVLWPRNTAGEMDRFRPGLLRGAALAALTAWAILSFTGVTTFIDSNF